MHPYAPQCTTVHLLRLQKQECTIVHVDQFMMCNMCTLCRVCAYFAQYAPFMLPEHVQCVQVYALKYSRLHTQVHLLSHICIWDILHTYKLGM